MQVFLGIVVFILILSAIVIIHEGGHFLVAKKSGILCYEYAIGMGPVLFHKKIGETVFSIRLIPIGGYVSMAGEDISENPLKGYEYASIILDENNLVKEIRVIKNLEDPIITKEGLDVSTFKRIVSADLIGTKEAKDDELYITLSSDDEVEEVNKNGARYKVSRTCILRYSKKQAFQIAPYDRLFIFKPIWKRFLTVFAGPFMNFVLAFVIFFILGCVTGYTNYKSTVVGSINESAPAYVAGLRDGDKVLYIGTDSEYSDYELWNEISKQLATYAKGEDFTGSVRVVYERDGAKDFVIVRPYVYVQSTYLFFKVDGTNSTEINFSEVVSNYEDLLSYKAGLRDGDFIYSITPKDGEEFIPTTRSEILAYFSTGAGAENSKFTIKVLRGEEIITLDEISTYKKQIFDDNNIEVTKVQLGISPTVTRNIGRLLVEPFKEIGSSCTKILKTLAALFKKNSGITVMDLSGPVGIASATVNLISQGPISVFNWMAILSVNIGLMNLLPLPALDGGRLAFILYEMITRKKANAKVENIVHTVGFILLMILFVFVAFNDVFKLFK